MNSLQVKCIRIHIDRNHIKPLAERRDMHVGFKVQLVVEFFIYCLCLGRCQIQKQNAMSEDVPASAPDGSIVSAWKKRSSLWVVSHRQQLTLLFCAHFLRFHLAPEVQFFSLWLQDGLKKWLGLFDYNGARGGCYLM